MTFAARLLPWWTVIVVGIACAFCVGSARGVGDQHDRREDVTMLVGENKKVRIEVYSPVRDEAVTHCPAALVLHGAGGMFFDGPEMRRVAHALTARGIRAYVVHYFNGSGISFTFDSRILQEHFEEWKIVIECAVDFAQSREGLPSRPVGIYGYSMGGFLGLAASSDDPRVGALVEQAGGVWENQFYRLGRMPPVLMIHGRADQRVPFKQFGVPLERALRTKSPGVQTLFFDGEEHVLRPVAQARAREMSAAFFVQQLGNVKSLEKPSRTARRRTISGKRYQPIPSP